MSICAVRTIKGQGQDGNYRSIIWLLANAPLPHEPKSERRYKLVNLSGTITNWDFAICKHCGTVYEIEES